MKLWKFTKTHKLSWDLGLNIGFWKEKIQFQIKLGYTAYNLEINYA
jgi:hypothetical protein